MTLKEGVLDPQGKTIRHALNNIGFQGVNEVRMGKYFEIRLDDQDQEAASEKLKRICHEMLSNPVIENYRFEILPEKVDL